MKVKTRVWGLFILAVALSFAVPATADSCRDWTREHQAMKAKAIRLYLQGAPSGELDALLFDLLQHEAYLTSCNIPARVARCQMIGWRLADRPTADFARAPLESVLEDAGFPVDMRDWFDVDREPEVAAARPRNRRR